MGNGSISKPFKSINTALGVANPGDTVFVRGGTYREKVVFPKSGTDDKRIVLKAYRNEKPLITGEGMNLTESYINVVHISGMSNITMEGFEVANFIAPDGVIEINGITVDAGASNVTLRGNHIHHIQNFNPYPGGGLCGGHAILIIGNNNRKMQNIVVESNKIHDCVTGYSETVTVNGYVDGFTVDGNEIYHCSNIGIDAAGGYAANAIPAYNYARNGVISGNVLYDISSVHGLVYERIGLGSIAIYADGSRNITIERNRIFGCDRGIGIVSETNNYPTTGCIVRNNIVYDCHLTGIYTGGYLGYTGGGSDNCYIVNNTLYGNNRATGPYANEIEGEIRFTENCRNNVVANNLICASSSTDLFVHKYTSTGSGNVFENNHYSGPGKWMWGYLKSNAISDFGVWKNTVGGDADGFYTSTPFFNLTPSLTSDFGIGNDSTVKNAGKVYTTDIVGTLDFAGNPRTVDAKISIGAIQ